jgi:ABC-type polysaccharide/polyol phosphate export permease
MATILLSMISYLTPLFYPITDLTPKMQTLVNLNPLTSYLDCFRWSLSSYSTATSFDWLYMIMSAIVMFLIGNYFFSKSWHKVVVMLG